MQFEFCPLETEIRIIARYFAVLEMTFSFMLSFRKLAQRRTVLQKEIHREPMALEVRDTPSRFLDSSNIFDPIWHLSCFGFATA